MWPVIRWTANLFPPNPIIFLVQRLLSISFSKHLWWLTWYFTNTSRTFCLHVPQQFLRQELSTASQHPLHSWILYALHFKNHLISFFFLQMFMVGEWNSGMEHILGFRKIPSSISSSFSENVVWWWQVKWNTFLSPRHREAAASKVVDHLMLVWSYRGGSKWKCTPKDVCCSDSNNVFHCLHMLKCECV